MNVNRIIATATVFLGLISAFSVQAQDVGNQHFDLVTHNSVVIEATPAAIWPRIVDPSEWKAGAKMVLVEGDPAKTGARFKAVTAEAPDQASFYFTNLEMVPEQRRTIRLNTPEGALIGYAVWELTPVEGGTEAAYHVYTEAVIPAAAFASMSAEEIDAVRAEYSPSNAKRFQAELETLKKLVEAPAQ